MMRAILFLGLILCQLLGLAQSLERQAYLSGGDCVLVGTITYTYSFGEAVVGTDQSNLPALTMGFQQPQPIIVLMAGVIALEAKPAGTDVWLSWTTESEEMGGEMEIIRQRDNGELEVIGQLAAQARRGRNAYQWQDPGVGEWQPTATYLVKWTQVSGAILLSQLVEVRFPAFEENFQLFPNPTYGDFFLRLPLEVGEKVQLSWFNLLGQQVADQAFSYHPDRQGMAISTNDLPVGTYWLWVRSRLGNQGVRVELR
jgi:hypothetical protein